LTAATTTNISLSSILVRSLKHRRARSLSALAALTVSAMVATALLTLYADLDAKLHHEFRSFGANIVATGPLTDADIQQARAAAGPDALIAPIAYAVAATDRGTPVVVAGVDFAAMQKLDKWWHLDKPWPTGPTDALIGQRAAGFVVNETAVTLTYSDHPITLHDAGKLSTGGDEDSRIYIPLLAFTAWTNVQPTVLEIQVLGGEDRVNSTIAALQRALPALHIEPVRALVAGESRIVDRTHALMYGAMLLIALTVAVSVLATLSASVLERRRDFALMKALGASQTQLIGHFLLEALVIATAGVILGYILGSLLAWGIGQWNFGTATLPRITLLPLVLLLNLAIATAAALFPARVLRGLQPAALLKGE
jgi:putative ABC transport system permease protein